MNAQNTQIEQRRRKSEQLTKDEYKAFLKALRTFPTKIDAAAYFDITRQVLEMVAIKGSGSPETITKVRGKINEAA